MLERPKGKLSGGYRIGLIETGELASENRSLREVVAHNTRSNSQLCHAGVLRMDSNHVYRAKKLEA